MERQPFITYREIDETNTLRYYILQKEFPHCIGKVLAEPNHGAIVQGVVPGYNLYIISDGVLRGNFIAVYPSYKEELQLTFDSMAAWYHAERILKDEKRYEKFKVKQNV
jgi:hypothetical protein